MNSTTSDPIQYETREETICWRYGKHREFRASATRTILVPVGTPEYKIPARNDWTLDMSKVAEAQAQAAQITTDLTS